jgi:hypothetical protein
MLNSEKFLVHGRMKMSYSLVQFADEKVTVTGQKSAQVLPKLTLQRADLTSAAKSQ